MAFWLLYKLSEIEFSRSLIKLIAFLATRKFKLSVEDEFCTPRIIAAGVPQRFVLATVVYCLYINDALSHVKLILFCCGRYLYIRIREA
jgi:hypothetical protein